MDDFVIFLLADHRSDFGGFEPLNALERVGRKVGQALCEFFAIGVAAGDGISRVKANREGDST